MKFFVCFLMVIIIIPVHSSITHIAQKGYYVCFDGRSMSKTAGGYVWDAKRGCFPSFLPCQVYRASLYGQFQSINSQMMGLAHCKENYPYHWGQMQTH